MEKGQQILVMKFGGTSVGSPEAMARMANIVKSARADWAHIVVVVSALTGVTDMLLQSAISAAQGDVAHLPDTVAELKRRHDEIIATLILPEGRENIRCAIGQLLSEFDSLCRAIAVLGEATPRALDAVASLGERMSVRLAAESIAGLGMHVQVVEATRLIVTSDHFQAAVPNLAATTKRIRDELLPLFDLRIVPVVTGFIGATSSGVVTTLGRGGSDYSAALIGAALPADSVWIWTDVDGVMTTDPRLVAEARTIPALTFREVSELAYFGAKVLHPKTIRPVIEAGIQLRVCNSFNPDHPGTYVIADDCVPVKGQIKAVTAIRNLRLVTIEGRGMLGVVGVAARTFAAVAATGTSVPLITQASSEQSICFAVPSDSANRVVSALESAFSREILEGDIDRVWASNEVVIVTVVGAGMRSTPGISGQVFSALGAANVNVIAIAQGSSEVSISMVVDAASIRPAVQAIHDLIIKGRIGYE